MCNADGKPGDERERLARHSFRAKDPVVHTIQNIIVYLYRRPIRLSTRRRRAARPARQCDAELTAPRSRSLTP